MILRYVADESLGFLMWMKTRFPRLSTVRQFESVTPLRDDSQHDKDGDGVAAERGRKPTWTRTSFCGGCLYDITNYTFESFRA